MGQYYYIINETKKEYLNPSKFGDGVKLREFGCSSNGTLTGLTLLLVDKETNGKGGGDFTEDGKDIVGRWHGDNIKIVGDYGDSKLYQEAQESWNDISQKVLAVMVQDVYIRESQEYNPFGKSLQERLNQN